MKLLSDSAPNGGYGPVTAPHIEASASALVELARLATAKRGRRFARTLHVRLSHFEHGGALSPQLYGFSILLTTGELVSIPAIPGLESKPASTGLRPPEAASAEEPLIYAVVANHPVAAQIEHILAMLATLVARQALISDGARLNIPEIDRIASETDMQATTAVTDILRNQGWRAAAEAISA